MSWQIQCHTCNAWRLEVPEALVLVIARCEKCGVQEHHDRLSIIPSEHRQARLHADSLAVWTRDPEEVYQARKRG